MLDVVAITNASDWQELAQEWTALIERCPCATPFQRPEWLLPWWRWFGSGEMAALAFYAEGRLVGHLPIFIHWWEGCRRVTLIGNGITDNLGLTAEPEYSAECARLAFQWLWRHRGRWDLCDWQDLPADSPLLAAQFGGLEATVAPHLNGTAAPIGADFERYVKALPHGLCRTIRLAARRLERAGELRFQTLRADHDASALRALFRLHEERWRDKGGPGSMMSSNSTQSFLFDVTQAFSARGMLRMYIMRFRGEPAAMIYGILDGSRLYGYITGMDPELGRYSPGSLLLHYAIRDAIADGARTWDFLRGQESYKFQWGAQTIFKRRMFIWHSAEFAPAAAAGAGGGMGGFENAENFELAALVTGNARGIGPGGDAAGEKNPQRAQTARYTSSIHGPVN